MKPFITYCFILLTSFVNAQTIKLDFEPQGEIVKFYFDSLTIYTDTTELFKVYEKDGTMKDYDLRVINLVKKEISKTKNDTVTFSGNFIPFNDSIKNNTQESWYVEWAILHLTKKKSIKIYDKNNLLVTRIKIKKNWH